MTASCPVPLGEVFAGKYRIDRVIGEGGMGVVVAAHHLELDQTVAIKFLIDDVAAQEEGAERFRREARAAAKIQSDHVVRVFDVGVLDTGERYMVMEYLDGRDLAEEVAARGPLPVDEVIQYLIEALDAIGHAHSVGIVHRDLKPANLFLAKRPDGSARVKVLDFGISKSLSQTSHNNLSLTKTSAWIGSPLYMSPEQMQSARDVDGRTDVWSLGAIAYELLTGQPPYLAETLPQLCNLLLTRDAEPIQTKRPDIPSELAEIVMRCLSRDLSQRFQSVSEVTTALGVPGGRATLVSASSMGGSGAGVSAMDRTELGDSSAIAHAASAGVSGRSTEASWAGTNGDSKKKPSRRGLKVGVAVAVLAVVGALLGFAGRGEGESPAAAAPTEAPVLTEAEAGDDTDRAVTDKAASVVASREAKKDAREADPSAEPAAAASAAVSAAPAPAAPQAPSPQAPPRVVAPRPRPRPQPVVKPTTQPTKPPSDLDAFGGRR